MTSPNPRRPGLPAAAATSAPAAAARATTFSPSIERLADLRAKGILSDEEFAAKKTELLSRL